MADVYARLPAAKVTISDFKESGQRALRLACVEEPVQRRCFEHVKRNSLAVHWSQGASEGTPEPQAFSSLPEHAAAMLEPSCLGHVGSAFDEEDPLSTDGAARSDMPVRRRRQSQRAQLRRKFYPVERVHCPSCHAGTHFRFVRGAKPWFPARALP